MSLLDTCDPLKSDGGNRAKKVPAWLLLAWLTTVLAAMTVLTNYSSAPGPTGEVCQIWPADSPITRQPGKLSLLLFAHPKCPCTRATIGELAIVMRHCREQIDCHVLFMRPSSKPDDWARTDLWQSASDIPRVNVAVDLDGREAMRFGAATSGAAVLFDADGRLLFHGGITSSRGHSGSNLARDSVIALARREKPSCTESPVFGCELFGRSQIAKSNGVMSPCATQK